MEKIGTYRGAPLLKSSKFELITDASVIESVLTNVDRLDYNAGSLLVSLDTNPKYEVWGSSDEIPDKRSFYEKLH